MEVFNIIRYKKYAHHKTSVLSGLSCSLFDFIQVAVASTHSVTCDESAYTAAGGHEPTPYTWVSSPLVGVKTRRQTRGVRTDAGRTGRTETTDCHLCQNFCSRCSKIAWSTVSKAADKSRRIRAAVSPRSTACSMSDSTRRTAVLVECPWRNPDCNDGRRSADDRYPIS